MRLDSLYPGATFQLDGERYDLERIENGRAWCTKEDGAIAVLGAHMRVDEYQPRRSFGQWFRQVTP